MSVEQVIFYVFAALAVISALGVITLKNVVHSAVALAATLLSVAGIFLTLHAEFLAGVQVHRLRRWNPRPFHLRHHVDLDRKSQSSNASSTDSGPLR
jgi:hypothetical protein